MSAQSFQNDVNRPEKTQKLQQRTSDNVSILAAPSRRAVAAAVAVLLQEDDVIKHTLALLLLAIPPRREAFIGPDTTNVPT